MKQYLVSLIFLLAVWLTIIIVSPKTGRTELVSDNEFGVPHQLSPNSSSDSKNLAPAVPSRCALQPELNKQTWNQFSDIELQPITLSRFRKLGSEVNPSTGEPMNRQGLLRLFNNSPSQPIESVAVAHPTNYGERFLNDLYGKPAQYAPIVVIHETVGFS
jgi:hypothetical protein